MQPDLKKQSCIKMKLFMGTLVTIKVVSTKTPWEVHERIERAFQAFKDVEEACSRFDEQSEAMKLLRFIGTPVKVSSILFETLSMAWQMADLTGGIFDPAIGHTLESQGFNRHYLTGRKVETKLNGQSAVSYKDIVLDPEKRTVLLKMPMILDLNAVAKGFAIDLAAHALREFEGFIVDAGGDVYAGGLNERNELWKVGIRHPLHKERTMYSLHVTDMAICTSGNYERVSPKDKNMGHLMNPYTKQSVKEILSSTVLSPYAMMADAFSTAAFILGKQKGRRMLDEQEINGLIVDSSLITYATHEMERYVDECK